MTVFRLKLPNLMPAKFSCYMVYELLFQTRSPVQITAVCSHMEGRFCWMVTQ